MDPIPRIRSFNRSVTQRIGAHRDRFMGRDRPLGEARMLWEVGRDGAGISELRRRLDLDSGYTSRLLRSLEEQHLVTVRVDPRDRRARVVLPTPEGQAEIDELDRRSDELAESLLTPLSERQRTRLVSAMAEVERLLVVPSAPIQPVPPDSDDARWCVARYFDELRVTFEDGFDASNALPVDPRDLTPPKGVCLVAYAWSGPIGTGSLKPIDAETGYIKRMWVAPSARGAGLGRRLLHALEDWATRLGYGRVRLETKRELDRAIAMYRAHGYTEIERFNDEVYGDFWFEKILR